MLEFNDREPIYLQIIADFKRKLINGTYSPGQPIASRRELAKQLGVNPNTVQRAYSEMEDEGFIHTARGQGSVLTTDAAVLHSVKREMIGGIVAGFITEMQALGIGKTELLQLVLEQLDAQGQGQSGGE
ncbi:GntR family transcriptional regulator [Paenibacillus sp. YYML68]|uniref:GntR family transcriptional regulator n=1 Tax=Paenibacillus sp. YYML68 TaxID=2909250 RepID=UPI00248F4F8B|nr:GntR family transcriptional regulator [Paenibacillus sp. YYML68]